MAVKCVFKRRDLICYDSKISRYRNLPIVVITVTEYNKAPGKLHCLWFVFSLPSYPSFLVLSITSFSNFRKTSPAAKVQLSLHNTLNFSAKSRQKFFLKISSPTSLVQIRSFHNSEEKKIKRNSDDYWLILSMRG